MHRTARFVSATLRMAAMTVSAAEASRPDVGSSRKRMDGLATSSTPIVTRLRASGGSPPGVSTEPMIASPRSLSPSRSRVLNTASSLFCLSAPSARRKRAENRSDSRTVARGAWISVCEAGERACHHELWAGAQAGAEQHPEPLQW